MSKIKKWWSKWRAAFIFFAIVFALLSAFCIDYSIWRAKHPEAPAWTYIFEE